MPEAIVAVDTGGTFTDLVLLQDGEVHVAKVLSTPDDPSRAVLAGLERLAERRRGPLAAVIHGSTVATNAVLERKGAKTALITNAGFEDLLTLGRQNRPSLYALRVRREPCLVPRDLCFGAPGRLTAEGAELEPLTDGQAARVAGRVAAAKAEAVAVCLLHSYLDPRHEQRIAEALRKALPGVPVSLSSEVLPQFREYERAAATVLNAYVAPRMAQYLGRLAESVGSALWIMRSDGGLSTAAEAAARPVHTLLSGPAGGVVGARQAGRSAGHPRVIAFDMGGTSTDVSLIDGEPALTRESSFAGLPLAVTTLDIHTVGAGGGSIAWTDVGGALKVGPQSAGASPGPACYGRGSEPTVTDAHVVLGRLPPTRFLGGEMKLQPARARAAVAKLAERLGLAVEATARGIVDVANAHMARAIKVISLERGHDPRGFALLAFGGAGGLHACELAATLGMSAVLVPRRPGLLSAVGMLAADVTCELAATLLEPISPEHPWSVERARRSLEPLERQAAAFCRSHGMAPEQCRLEALFDMRYRGQSFELPVAVPVDGDLGGVPGAFEALHERRYGYRLGERPIEWVSLRLRARGLSDRSAATAENGEGTRSARPNMSGPYAVWRREQLGAGTTVIGPAVVSEYSATTWVPPEWRLEVLPDGALRLQPGQAP